MKLNLLPVSASKGSGAKLGIPVAVILVVVAIVLAMNMMAFSSSELRKANADVEMNTSAAQKAVDVSNNADAMMQEEKGPLLNLKLAQAMMDHNKVYPDFYDKVIKFIPNFFRINSLNAAPIDANSCSVNMVGFLGSYEQFNYMSLALLRVPGVQAVTRSGYSMGATYVPNINTQDTVGRRIPVGGPRLTDDPIQRLDAKIATAGHTEYTGAGGFGTLGFPKVRGAMPSEQTINVGLIMAGKLQTPNPRETLAGAQGAYGSFKPQVTAASVQPGGAAKGKPQAPNSSSGSLKIIKPQAKPSNPPAPGKKPAPVQPPKKGGKK